MSDKDQRRKILESLDVERFYTEVGDLVLSETEDGFLALCPFHEDRNPSLAIRKTDGVFNCFGCSETGSVFDFYSKTKKVSFKEAWKIVAEFAGVESEEDGPPVELNEEEVEEWHRNLLKNKARLKFLQEKRGLTLDTIKQCKLGHDEERFTIPVYEDGKLVNVRRYLPNAPRGVSKVIGLRGHNERRLLFTDVFKKGAPILLCEGEMDSIIARQSGFNATTVTSGAGNWVAEWNEKFKGEEVILSYDKDSQGKKGTEKVGRYLATTANSVKVVQWPQDFKEKGDVTDYILEHGAEAYRALLDLAEEFVPTVDSQNFRFPLTDLGNAERLIDKFGESFLYVTTWKQFYVWTGKPKWEPDERDNVTKWAIETVRGMLEEAKSLPKEAGSVLEKWEKTSESSGKISAMIELAGSKAAIGADEFNKDPWTLNTPNGVVSLKQ